METKRKILYIMKTAEIITIDPKEYGVEKSKATELMGNLPTILKERKELEKQYSEITKQDIENPETAKQARELRLIVQKNRTQGINIWHKTTKDYFLKGGQFVDAIKRKEVAVNERMESQLEEIEKHAEIQEQRRIEALRKSRIQDLETYAEFVPFGIELGTLSDEEYQKVYNGAKLQHEAKIEAEKKAKAERLENERLDALEKERRFELSPYAMFVSDSNMKLREMTDKEYSELLKSLQEAKKEYEAEQEKIRKENERLKKEAEAKEKQRQAEIKAQQEKEAKERAEREAELKKEREKQAILEAELQAKKDAEAKAEKERQEAEARAKKEAEKLAKAPIKKQLHKWVNDMTVGNPPVLNETSKDIIDKFESFKSWSLKQIENL